jgi:hypothetical protein
VLLNRLISAVLIIMIVLSITDYMILKTEITALHEENYHNLQSERRVLSIIQIGSNIRSLCNVAN